VALTGCSEDLDLGPLLQLAALNNLSLSARRRLPRLAVLSAVQSEWTLTLESPAYANQLTDLTGLTTLTTLHLRGGDDLRDLRGLLALPNALRKLSLFGFPNLARLDGIDQWQGLTTIEFFDCPQLTSFASLASLTSLETIALGLFPDRSRNLSPLTSLPRLRELSLQGHSEFDVNSLAGAQDLVIFVPPKAKVVGADKLGRGSRISEFASSP